jgi:hypothetical protein
MLKKHQARQSRDQVATQNAMGNGGVIGRADIQQQCVGRFRSAMYREDFGENVGSFDEMRAPVRAPKC